MPYITLQQLTQRFTADELVQLTNTTDPSATEIDESVLSDAITDVDALIDAKLSARYALPLSSVPLVLANVAADLVRARLHINSKPDHVAERERAALKLLDQMAEGKVQLGLDAAQQATASSEGPQFTSGGRTFSPSSLADYR